MVFYWIHAGAIDIEELFMTEEEIKAFTDDAEEMFQQIKPIVESYNGGVAFQALMIVLAACGNQLEMPPDHFKALVVLELDRLMPMVSKGRHEH